MYDRDQVRRLERELEAAGDGRFRPYHIDEETKAPAPDPLQVADRLAEAARKYRNAIVPRGTEHGFIAGRLDAALAEYLAIKRRQK